MTNNPSTQNMTKADARQPLVHQPGQVLAEVVRAWPIVGTNDGNVWIGFNLGTGVAGQANWVNVTGGNAVLPNRPVLGIALDPSSPTVAHRGRLRGGRRLQRQHAVHARATSSRSSAPRAARRSPGSTSRGNLPDIPVDSVIVNPNFPQQVFAGTDFGLYFTNDINAASPIWQRFTAGMPNAMIWDMQIDRGVDALSLWTRGRGAYAWPLPNAPVNQLNQTITFGPLADQPYTAPTSTVSATASSGLPVSFTAGANGTCS